MTSDDPTTSEFPVVDRPSNQRTESMPTVVTPGDDVPTLRAEARASFGDPAAPMIEIDHAGRIVYVAGDWHALTGFTHPGQLGFPVLARGVDDAEALRMAIGETLRGRGGAVFTHRSAAGDGHLRVVPIPSPRVAGRPHALVGLGTSDDVASALPVSMARHAVRPEDVADLRARQAAAAAAADAHAAAATGSDEGPRDWGHDAASESSAHEPSPFERRRIERATPVLAAAMVPETVADLDRRGDLAHDAPQPPPATGLITGDDAAPDPVAGPDADPPVAARPATGAGAAAGLVALLYVAFHGLFLGPNHGWWSPLDLAFDNRPCLAFSPCDQGVSRLNHLGVLALLGALVLLIVRFRSPGIDVVNAQRPARIGTHGSDEWRPTLGGAGGFAWAAIACVAFVALQTVTGSEPSMWPWLASIGLGGVAAWCADRDAQRPLGATMAALAYAPGVLLLVVGVGGFWLGERRLVAVVLIAAGVGALAWSVWLFEAGRSSFDRIDLAAMTGLALLALVLAMLRQGSWRYAFIGDEWAFYFTAIDDLRGREILGTFEVGGSNDYYIGLTFEAQAAVMRLVGDDVHGWRLASLLPLVLSVPAMYAVTRWLVSRRAAIVAAAVLAAGHVLLSFSMVPYNSTQALVTVAWSLAALAWAHQRPSALRLFVLGAVAGTTFLVYAVARLGLLPVGLLFLMIFRDDLASLLRRLAWVVLGGLCVAAPTFFSIDNWGALLKATPVEAEPDVRESGVVRQLFDNAIDGFLLFIGRTPESHYVAGPHLDLLSAGLLIAGIAWAVVRSRRDRVVRWFVIGGVAWWTLTSAIQQYSFVSITRSFMLPLIYCVFAGVGFHAVVNTVEAWRARRAAAAPTDAGAARGVGWALAALIVGVVVLNQWHITGHADNRHNLTEQALLVREFTSTESVDGDGMNVHVAWAETNTRRLVRILLAHGVAPERISTTPSDGELDLDRLCASSDPTMVNLDHDHPKIDDWRRALEACWGQPAVEIANPAGALRLLRLTNEAGAAEFGLDPSDRFRRGVSNIVYEVRDVVDVAIDGDGVAYGLVRSSGSASLHRLDGGGSFRLIQPSAFDVAITATGHFVVAATGGDDRLVWYDGAGNVVARFRGHDELPAIGGVAVDGDLVWFSDPVRRQVTSVALSGGTLELVESRSAAGSLGEAGSLAIGPNGGVWVHDTTAGLVVLIDRDDAIAAEASAPTMPPVDAPRVTATGAGWLVQSLPELPAIRLIDDAGRLVDERNGVSRPVAAALGDGQLIAADRRWHEQPVLVANESWQPPVRGAVNWDTARPLDGGYVEFAGPYADEAVLPPSTQAPVEVAETDAVDLVSGQSWQRIGVDDLADVHAIDSRGGVTVVVDTTGQLVRLDGSGATIEAVAVGDGETFISDVAIDDAGVAWLLDAGIGQIIRVGPDGERTVLQPENAGLGNARGISAAPDGGVWVASTAAASVTRLDAGGEVVGRVETPGRQPTDAVAMADGTLWVVDGERYELVRLEGDGTELAVLGLDGFSSFESPHLALDSAIGLLWLSGPETSTVQAIDPVTGAQVSAPASVARPDGTRLDKAIGIAVDDGGAVWVADARGGAVVVVEPDD